MPYTSQWVPAEVFVQHAGVSVYHVYRNDDMAQGRRQFWYGLSDDAAETDGTAFDVRDLPQWDPGYGDDASLAQITAVLVAAIDAGELVATLR